MSNALLALIAARKAATSSVKTIKPNAGRNRYRILPSWRSLSNAPSHLSDDEKASWVEQFYQDFGQHFVKDAAGAVKAVYVCVDKTYGRPCQLCEEINRGILNSTDDTQKKRLEDTRAAGRVLLNVLALDTPLATTPQVLEIAPTVFNGNKGVGGIIQGFVDWPNMVDLAKGCDVIIEKSGTGKDTRYGVSFVPSATGPVDASVMSKVADLDKFVAQENQAGHSRALASVSAITGLLPSPVAPSLTASAAAAFVPAGPAQAMVIDDVPDFVEIAAQNAAATQVAPAATTAPAPAPVAAPAPAPVAAPAAPVVPDNDLEALLAGLK